VHIEGPGRGKSLSSFISYNQEQTSRNLLWARVSTMARRDNATSTISPREWTGRRSTFTRSSDVPVSLDHLHVHLATNEEHGGKASRRKAFPSSQGVFQVRVIPLNNVWRIATSQTPSRQLRRRFGNQQGLTSRTRGICERTERLNRGAGHVISSFKATRLT
jgi:hypothetical protein